jgi:hypothetical protein
MVYVSHQSRSRLRRCEGAVLSLDGWGVAPQAVEIKTIALIPLSQIFFAEFLITLPASQVTAKLKCS